MTTLHRLVGVIDDNPSVGKALRRLLRTAGFEVIVYTSTEENLADSRRNEIDCLVIDVRLPGMSGLDLHEMDHQEGRLPTLFITAQEDVGVRLRALAGGAVGFFLKPFENRELLDAVFRALDVAEP